MAQFALGLVLLALHAAAEPPQWQCGQADASVLLQQGTAAQTKGDSLAAEAAYQECLKLSPDCHACRYELGWSFWKQGKFSATVREWTLVRESGGAPEDIIEKIAEHLPLAQARETTKPFTHPAIGTESTLAPNAVRQVTLKLMARFQSYDPKGPDYDPEVSSPKSAAAHPKGKKIYIQSLEAKKTVVFTSKPIEHVGSIEHTFTQQDEALFYPKTPPGMDFPDTVPKEARNVFSGKPVEAAFSHQGRYLYVPYYRREYDALGTMPSAMAVIDTRKDKIVRVLPTGPISKYVAVSPNGKLLAISNWGDNTLHLVDISSKTPKGFRMRKRLVVEAPLPLEGVSGDRDHACGFCLRGLAFTKDNRYLFVTRMRGGGIALLDLKPRTPKYLGSVFGIWPSPRDIVITRDGRDLFVSCNSTGHISKIRVQTLIKLIRKEATKENQFRVRFDRKTMPIVDATVGIGARTMRLSKDQKLLFVAINVESKIAVVDAQTLTPIASIPADPYPVGLDLTPDGKQLWLTSQGRDGVGGNSVEVFSISRKRQRPIKGNE